MKRNLNFLFIFTAWLPAIITVSSGIVFAFEISELINKSNTEEQLIKTDKEFSEKSLKEGMASAFLAYAADDVILMRENQFPIMGKKNLEDYYSEVNSGNAQLEWSPAKAEVAESGELGYTFGNWIYTTKDDEGNENKVYGNYITVWKKQQDGNWKFVLDGGNTTPNPDEK